MSEDAQRVPQDKSRADKFIPPPMDPYATYQTPYERRQAPEPNPFIEFRRFADKQLSEIFSSFQTFANFPKMFGVEDGMKSLRDQLEKDMKEMIAQQNEMQSYRDDPEKFMREALARRDRFEGDMKDDRDTLKDSIKKRMRDTYRPVPGSATAATSFSEDSRSDIIHKQIADAPRTWVSATGADGKQYRIDLSTGNAVAQPPAHISAPESEPVEDPKTRWRRGFQNCPELKKYRGETELDVYERFEDQQRSSSHTDTSTRSIPSWSSWLPAYGHDGIQKSKKVTKTPTATDIQEENPFVQPCQVQTYKAGQAKRMDPLRNDHEFLPWLILSPYSPLSLANPGWAHVKSATLHNGCEGGCSEPVHIYSHRYRDNAITEQDDKLRAAMAEKVAWADAFEDLVGYEKTGKMPDREGEGRIHPKNMTDNWIRDMISNGLLGPKWWVADGEIMRDSRNDPKARPTPNKRNIFRNDSDTDVLSQEYTKRMNDDLDAFIPIAAEATEHLREVLNHFGINIPDFDISKDSETHEPQQTQRTSSSTSDSPITSTIPTPSTTQPEISNPSQSTLATLTPSNPPQPDHPQSTPSLPSPPQPKPSITSTLTTTTTRTLPDGSTQTKRILKKRFADGNEESEESTEVVHPRLPEVSSRHGQVKVKSDKSQGKPGWFWT